MFYLHPTLLTIIHFLNFFIIFQFCYKTVVDFYFCTNTMIVRNGNGGIDMIDQPMEFFRNLPTKTCAHCGKKLMSNTKHTITNVMIAFTKNSSFEHKNLADIVY